MLELVFDKVVWTNFPMGFSTETSVGRTGTWARCNRHREHYELVYLVVKIRVVLNEKWRSKVGLGDFKEEKSYSDVEMTSKSNN
ncbi:hypothetical protein DY000_02048479 [Brassica cretica]|uniref:Uncharacterized protein n=1 Tax=Brassica cretica TaxID=69181 RepID=A0ABQ7ER57_BRACR|nr:hypothetical protein DY000_02048479 [Brassica cretica]